MSNTPYKNTDYEVLMFGVLEGIRQAAAGENTVERVHKSLMKLIKDWHEQAQSDYLERVMPEKLNRIEVIDDTGRAYVKGDMYGTPVSIQLSLQDEERTLKVFVSARKEAGDE